MYDLKPSEVPFGDVTLGSTKSIKRTRLLELIFNLKPIMKM